MRTLFRTFLSYFNAPKAFETSINNYNFYIFPLFSAILTQKILDNESNVIVKLTGNLCISKMMKDFLKSPFWCHFPPINKLHSLPHEKNPETFTWPSPKWLIYEKFGRPCSSSKSHSEVFFFTFISVFIFLFPIFQNLWKSAHSDFSLFRNTHFIHALYYCLVFIVLLNAL